MGLYAEGYFVALRRVTENFFTIVKIFYFTEKGNRTLIGK
jgi:hypothetical protein